VLVVMAGIYPRTDFAEMTLEMRHQVIDINLGGTLSGTVLIGMPGQSG
jgi:NADP-dependent 3-hydroxy acid dehydrogenase YdfG